MTKLLVSHFCQHIKAKQYKTRAYIESESAQLQYLVDSIHALGGKELALPRQKRRKNVRQLVSYIEQG